MQKRSLAISGHLRQVRVIIVWCLCVWAPQCFVSKAAGTAPIGNHIGLVNPFDPTTFPFGTDDHRYRPSFNPFFPVRQSFLLASSGGRNATKADTTMACPPGMVFMIIDFASAGLAYGWEGGCPADYNPDMSGIRPLADDICRSNTRKEGEGWIYHTCHAKDSYQKVYDNCAGRNSCWHYGDEADYEIICPKYRLLWKSFAVAMSCGSPVLSRITPAIASYAAGQTLHLTGARGPDPGKYLDIKHCTIHFRVLSGPSIGEYSRNCTFISSALLSVPMLSLPVSNYNVTTMLSVWYDDFNTSYAARSNEFALLSAAPIFTGWSVYTMPSHTNTAVQLFGNYFVDTGHIIARLTVEDGTVSIVNVTYVNPQTLQLNIPPHNVPMLWVGLEVTVEVSHEAVDPSISLNQRLWQIVASETNSIDSAIRVHYYDYLTLPGYQSRILQFGVTTASSLNKSWVHVSNFTGTEHFPDTEVCRFRHGNAPVPYATITDPQYEIPAHITGQKHNRLRIPDVINCYKVPHNPLKSMGGTDFLIQKYNKTRGLIWAIRGGGTANDDAAAVTVDSKGNIFVAVHVHGLTTLGSKLMARGLDSQREVRYTGSQTSNRIRKVVVTKYDRGGKFIWASEVGACLRNTCKINTIDVDEQGYVYVTGSFYSTISVGVMCGTNNCQTVKPLRSQHGSEMHSLLRGDRTCILENMEAYNDTARCQHVPAALLKSSTPCTEAATEWFKCQTDIFISRLDQNGTVFWFHNIATNQTYIRDTPLAFLYRQRIQPWIDSALLAYRQIPEKLSASKHPDTTLLLLRDRHIRISPIFPSLKDAYHIEIQLNRTKLSYDMIQKCVNAVNVGFEKLRHAVLAGNLEFFEAAQNRATFIASVPGIVSTHEGITPPARLYLPNAGAYRLLVSQTAFIDFEFDKFTRKSIIDSINGLNDRINLLEKAVMTYDDNEIIAGFGRPGLMLAGVVRKLFFYYADRIKEMRRALSKPLYHRELQSVFECTGSGINDFPVRPTNQDMQVGGTRLIMKLSADKFNVLNDERKALLVKNVVSRFLPGAGFQYKVRSQFSSTAKHLITLSPDRSILTIEMPKAPSYYVNFAETVTVSVPAKLTETGSTYPFMAQFVVRPDNAGILWNTNTTLGDLYALPTETVLREGKVPVTAHMPIAGDLFKPLTAESRSQIIKNFVPSGYDSDWPIDYKWNTYMRPQLEDDDSRMWLDMNNTRLNLKLDSVQKYDIPVSETITVTIPGSVTQKGFDHPIGSFVIKNSVGGTLVYSLNSDNTGSGSYNIELPIQGDRFVPRSLEAALLIANTIHSPNIPHIENGFMKIIKPLILDMATNFKNWKWNDELTKITVYLPAARAAGYNPKQEEVITWTIPPECSQLGYRHVYEPLRIFPGSSGSKPPWFGESVKRYLPWNNQALLSTATVASNSTR